MQSEKLKKLMVRQQALKDAIKEETRQTKVRKQKALFGAVQRAGLLDLSDDELEAALKAYQTARSVGNSEPQA